MEKKDSAKALKGIHSTDHNMGKSLVPSFLDPLATADSRCHHDKLLYIAIQHQCTRKIYKHLSNNSINTLSCTAHDKCDYKYSKKKYRNITAGAILSVNSIIQSCRFIFMKFW